MWNECKAPPSGGLPIGDCPLPIFNWRLTLEFNITFNRQSPIANRQSAIGNHDRFHPTLALSGRFC
jgi:hypothetical protein